MNIQTVAQNLRNTIAGREKMLTEALSFRESKGPDYTPDDSWYAAFSALHLIIIDLKKILNDVESCIVQDVEQSWRDNPDRSGGQFTQDEIDNAGKW